MRKVACLLALLCAGCAAQAVPKQSYTYTFNSTEVLSARNKPAGYYPGYADFGLTNIPKYKEWLAQNEAKIDDIQARISAMGEGRTAPGCIGEDRFTCIATLAQKFAIADYSHEKSVVADQKYDVNGKPLASEIEFVGYVPRLDATPDANPTQTTFIIKMGRNGLVSMVDAELPTDPTRARTQDEYNATDVYETVAALTAKRCPALSREDVAKWIENTVKPELRSYRGRVLHMGTAKLERSKKMSFCGRTFQFDSLAVIRGTKAGRGWALVVE